LKWTDSNCAAIFCAKSDNKIEQIGVNDEASQKTKHRGIKLCRVMFYYVMIACKRTKFIFQFNLSSVQLMSRPGRSTAPSLPSALITVGTTKFESLIECIETQASAFCHALQHHGVTSLTVQTGSMSPAFTQLRAECQRCAIEFVTFGLTDPAAFKQYMQNADLVITHAGAGSILETLRLGKSVLAVVNERLQENHQVELAEALAGPPQYLFWSTCDTLCASLLSADFERLLPYPSAEPTVLARRIDRLMGFAS
jgi:beta-1,4-N-acetylglucosaminyltransferase